MLLGELERLLRTYIRYLVDRGLRTTQFMDLVCSPTSARSGPSPVVPAVGLGIARDVLV